MVFSKPSADISTEHLSGTLKETLNMIAGNTFSKVDQSSSFCLGVPEIYEDHIHDFFKKKTISKQNSSPKSIIIDIMDGFMVAAVQLRSL